MASVAGVKRHNIPVEFLFQVFALVVSVIIVHGMYVSVVRPQAAEVMAEQRAQMAVDENYVPERSIYVLIRDFEQETCFILMLWAMAIMGFKAWQSLGERRMLQRDLVPLNEGMSILPEDTRQFSRPVQALPEHERNRLLPRALLTALHRFRSTRNIQDVSTAVRTVCESESERLDSELSMVRYIAWAIPSIGFIGTVRGIGEALGQAHQAVEGNISGVTESLGVAFNSTFIALLLSIVLMFLMHQLQLLQERLVLESQDYCDDRLVQHLQVR
ncbi:MAG: MotA/TolQ/ExbB proton channel family protein [Gammaproteobacteria bacterium]|nr:MotA/TolQ/ExbB proton channel family protein [Gammaproteobacteria bacterium]NND60978.1 MotA/TolQ/ExbB proton channel family protein [Gammaproteobacteria bacterium]